MTNEKFKTMLLYPPVADFTQPYPAIPYLAGFLKAKGENVVIKDINLDAHDYILTDSFLKSCYDNIKDKFEKLNEKQSLDVVEQREYVNCLNAIGVNEKIISESKTIKEKFVNKDLFFNYDSYLTNINYLKQAFHLISASYFPMKIEPCIYTSPYFLTNDEDIEEQTVKEKNPFIAYYEKVLIPYINQEKPDLIGLSVIYPTQILQMFAVADIIKKAFPNIHICAGGAFICRLALNLKEEKFESIFKYIDSIVLYEGETALYNLISYLKNPSDKQFKGHNTIFYDRKNNLKISPSDEPYYENLDNIPAPDYDGYPLDKYFSPIMFLPYSPTRGCYWNKCTFCHYGATKHGTTRYREKQVELIISDLDKLYDKYKTHYFSFCVDVISPKTSLAIADEIVRKQRPYIWNTDVRVEEAYTPDVCQKLKQGGCHAVAIGLESGNERILKLMNKGITSDLAKKCIKNFSDADIITQVMTFLNFPSETSKEAAETIKFISDNEKNISLFTMGNFEILNGSKIFKKPDEFGIKRIYSPDGDDYNTLILYEESKKKSEMERAFIESESASIGNQYADNDFPFVGAVSTNHSLLYFEHFGKDILKKLSQNIPQTKEIKNEELARMSTPILNPSVRILEGKFSLNKLHKNIEYTTGLMSEALSEVSYRDKLKKLMGSKLEFPTKSFYMLLEDMKWIEMPSLAKQIVDLCDGNNKTKDIINKYPKEYRDSIQKGLNQLLSYNILIRKTT